MTAKIPPWVLFHVPHDSRHIPIDLRPTLCLSDEELHIQLNRMTDHHTRELLATNVPESQCVVAPVSRLIVDVERFRSRQDETMESCGMGAVYLKTDDGRPLRHPITDEDREALLARYYDPHHAALLTATQTILDNHNRCLILDCHSYPRSPRPYELNQTGPRPEICLGTDSFHTPQQLTERARQAFQDADFEVALDTPFAGTLVPLPFYQQDKRIQSLMIEVRRDLYVNEDDEGVSPKVNFNEVQEALSLSITKLTTS